jgi:hypothetical protein
LAQRILCCAHERKGRRSAVADQSHPHIGVSRLKNRLNALNVLNVWND